MDRKILYNNRLLPAETPLVGATSRGLRYGDGLFETIKAIEGRPLLAAFHWDRLWSGLNTLQFIIPPHFTPSFLEQEIHRLCRSNGHNGWARVRINIFRGDGGVNDPVFHHPEYIIETWPLEKAFTPGDSHGLEAGVFPHGRKALDAFANLKSNNYLVYLMGALWATSQKLNECLILNTEERIADASISNLFFIRGGVVHTPPLSEGGVAGVLRRFLLEQLPSWGYVGKETAVTTDYLAGADEIFLTNAITGIRWVKGLGDQRYTHDLSGILCRKLEHHFS
jgi:branched-chain amino acid aminotransferase